MIASRGHALRALLLTTSFLTGCGDPAPVELTPEEIKKINEEDKRNLEDEKYIEQNIKKMQEQNKQPKP